MVSKSSKRSLVSRAKDDDEIKDEVISSRASENEKTKKDVVPSKASGNEEIKVDVVATEYSYYSDEFDEDD